MLQGNGGGGLWTCCPRIPGFARDDLEQADCARGIGGQLLDLAKGKDAEEDPIVAIPAVKAVLELADGGDDGGQIMLVGE